MFSYILILCVGVGVLEANVKVLRSSGNGRHPEMLHLEVQVPGESPALLKLERIDKFKNMPISLLNNGKKSRFSASLLDHSAYAHYHDMAAGAVLAVRKREAAEDQFSGHFTHKGSMYSVSPAKEGLGHEIKKETAAFNFRGDTIHRGKRSVRVAVANRILDTHLFKQIPKFRERIIETRKKRQVPNDETTYVVELGVALDHTVYNFFLNGRSETEALAEIHYQYSYILTAMDVAFRKIQSFSISIECIDLLIAQTEADAGWMLGFDSNPDSLTILNKMGTWFPSSSSIKGDHIMAFTKKDLTSNGNKNVAGMAMVGGTCDRTNCFSINEDSGFNSWFVTAHELGHNLGAGHDDNTACSGGKNIMNAVGGGYDLSNLESAYKFSSCSESVMQNFVNRPSSSCLTRDDGPRFTQFSAETKPGLKYTPDQICKLLKPNSQGLFVSNDNRDNPESMCANLFCKDAEGSGGTGVGPAPLGFVCGDKKICTFNGKCEFDESAPSRDQSCFFGNTISDQECQETKSNLESYPEYKDFYCPYFKENCCTMSKSVCP